MNHSDHVSLIKNGVGAAKVWADLGSGEGAFTLALREIGGEKIEIYSIDKNLQSLHKQKQKFLDMFSSSLVSFIEKDFTQNLDLPKLDGILMANALHFVEDQETFLKKIKKLLKPKGKLLLVEYNSNSGNQWVPYPVSFQSFKTLSHNTGFKSPELIGKTPSHFLDEIYAAVTTALD